MARTCTICSHPQRSEIDRALLASEPLRKIARRHKTSVAALHRHRSHIAAAVQAQQALTVERLLSDLADLQRRALALLTKAENAGDLRAALAAIRETRGVVESAARLIEVSELRRRIEALEQQVGKDVAP
ncbi:MAG: hypothetical protein ACUVX9_15025 [Anaerolineae bacterium]